MFERAEKFNKVFREKTGLEFSDLSLLTKALTHDSAGRKGRMFERFEFLGDSCLDLYISEHLVNETDLPEGQMSQLRALLTSRIALAQILRCWKVEESFLFGGSMKDKQLSDMVYADLFESVLGALYLDSGHEACKKTVEVLFIPLMNSHIENLNNFSNPKSRLQEMMMSQKKELPVYNIINKSGPAHCPVYELQVVCEGGLEAVGSAGNIKDAEIKAASALLEKLGH